MTIKKHWNRKNGVEMVKGWHGRNHVFLRLYKAISEGSNNPYPIKIRDCRFSSKKQAEDAYTKAVVWVNAQ